MRVHSRAPGAGSGSDAGQESGDDDDDAPAEPAKNRQKKNRPQTRAEMNQLREQHANSMELVRSLLHDRDLQTSLRMVYEACVPYMM